MSNKLCLGTVQLGTKYGIKNELGRQPTNEESFAVLRKAIDSGIEYFDTASVYGNAESILGDFGIGDYPVKVISKLKPDLEADAQVVLREIRQSLARLQTESIYGYMLHRAADFYRREIMDGLVLAKEKGLIQSIGVSIYEPEDALQVVSDTRVDCIQIPYNVFDQRLDQTDFFELAEKNHVRVFARSAFLQGLLLMEPENVPKGLSIAIPYIKRFREIVFSLGYTPIEAAFLFSYKHVGISEVVFGVDTKNQLEKNLQLLNKADGFDSCQQVLKSEFKVVARKVIMPSLW